MLIKQDSNADVSYIQHTNSWKHQYSSKIWVSQYKMSNHSGFNCSVKEVKIAVVHLELYDEQISSCIIIASIPTLSFYRPDALPADEQTVPKH